MSIKEQVIKRLDTLSETELVQVNEFLAFLKFRARLQSMPALDEAQLSALYAAGAEGDSTLAEAGMADYRHGLCQEDAS